MYHKLKKCLNSRSSHQRCSIEKAVLKSFVIFTGKYLRWSFLLIDLQASRPAALLKRDSNTGVFLWILQMFQKMYIEENLGTITCAIPLLTVTISSKGLVSALHLIGPLQRSSSRFKELSLGCLMVGSCLIWKKKH